MRCSGLLLTTFAGMFCAACPIGFAQPAATQPAVTVEPASGGAAAEPSAQAPVMLVLPVNPPAGGNYGWVGRAIQEDLIVDLTRATRARPIAPPSAPAASDPSDALRVAREHRADYVLYGSAQLSGNQFRVTGQVLSVATGQPIGALKSTAPFDNLFPLEDDLAGQVVRALPQSLVVAPPPVPQAGMHPAEPQVAPLPGSTYQSYTYSPSLPPGYYSYQDPGPYYYNYYDYGYPAYYPGYVWWGPDVVFFGGGYYGWHHHWGHDGDHFAHGFYPHGRAIGPHGYYSAGHVGGGGGHGGGGGGHSGGGGGGGRR